MKKDKKPQHFTHDKICSLGGFCAICLLGQLEGLEFVPPRGGQAGFSSSELVRAMGRAHKQNSEQC